MFLYRLAKYRNNSNNDTAWIEYFLLEIPIETAIILINPSPFLMSRNTFRFTAIKLNNSQIQYLDNDLLHILALLKLFLFIRALLTRTIFFSDRAHRVCGIFSAKMDYRFVLKCIMRERPFALSFAWLAIGVLYFGHAIRITEKPLKQASDYMDHSSYFNCLWAAFITMSTVGYGDVYPRTNKGRIVMIFCCFYGTVALSLMIVSIIQILHRSHLEELSFLLINRVSLKKKVKSAASTLISNYYRFTKKISQKESVTRDEEDWMLAKIEKVSEEFQATCSAYKEVLNDIPFQVKTHREFDQLVSDIHLLKKESKEICEILNLKTKDILSPNLKLNPNSF